MSVAHRSERRSLTLAVGVAVFVVLRVLVVVHAPLAFHDTPTYLSLDFLGYDSRLWTVPLVWTLFATPDLREAAQLGLGCLAWAALARAVYGLLPDGPVALAAAIVVLCLGLIPSVAGWDNILLSESLASSLQVLLIALLLNASRQISPRLLAAILAVATLWTFTRHENVILYLALLPFLIGFAVWQRRRRSWPVVAALVAIGLWGGFAVSRSGSALVVDWNSLQIIENRIAPHPAALRFFARRGLPVTREVLAERGAFPGHVSPLFGDPRVMAWVTHRFKSVYLAYLWQRLPQPVTRGFAATPYAATGSTEALAQPRNVLPALFERGLWSSQTALAVWAAVAALLTAVALARRRVPPAAPVIALLALSVVVGAVLTWNLTGYSDAAGGGDLPRLFLPVALMLHVGLVLLVASCLAALSARLRT